MSCLVVIFAQSIEARYYVDNEDVVGAARTCDAPTTFEYISSIYLVYFAPRKHINLYTILKKPILSTDLRFMASYKIKIIWVTKL